MKLLRIFLFTVIVLAVIYSGFSLYRQIGHKKEIEKSIISLPSFSFQKQGAGTFHTSDINAGCDKIIISYYDPNCEHCQYMADQLVQNADKFLQYQLILVTAADSLPVDRFMKNYQLNKKHNFILLRDTKYEFKKIFGADMVPSYFVYHKKNLVKKILGETKVENLLVN